MNFIGVLAVIAGLGFAVSAVGFIEMGVSGISLLRLIDGVVPAMHSAHP
jgi:cation-transporting ATPase 13A3/4/5